MSFPSLRPLRRPRLMIAMLPVLATMTAYAISNDPISWIRQFGDPDYTKQDVVFAADASEKGIFVVGTTSGSLPFQNNASGMKAFVRRYKADGTPFHRIQTPHPLEASRGARDWP